MRTPADPLHFDHTVDAACVMRFTGGLTAATSLADNRPFVERGGKVFCG